MTQLWKERTDWQPVGLEGWDWRDEGSGSELVGKGGSVSVSPSWCDCGLQHVTTGEAELKHSLYYFLQLHVNLLHLKILNVIIIIIIISRQQEPGQVSLHMGIWTSSWLPCPRLPQGRLSVLLRNSQTENEKEGKREENSPYSSMNKKENSQTRHAGWAP